MKKDWETDGLRNGKPVYCPVNCHGTHDCPYSDEAGVCHLADPIEDCDDFGAMWASWKEYDDADDVDEDAPEDFSEDEIEFAERVYGYRVIDDYEEVGYNPFMGGYDYDC